jgi:hypothetical protein
MVRSYRRLIQGTRAVQIEQTLRVIVGIARVHNRVDHREIGLSRRITRHAGHHPHRVTGQGCGKDRCVAGE